MIDFYVGQKVVCVNTSGLSPSNLYILPEEGKIYTVRFFGPTPRRIIEAAKILGKNACTRGVRLAEINLDLGSYRGADETVFSPGRFRPLIQTDISVFTAMLTPAPADTREAADA